MDDILQGSSVIYKEFMNIQKLIEKVIEKTISNEDSEIYVENGKLVLFLALKA